MLLLILSGIPVVIAIVYAPIAPLMMGFATIGLCLYYQAFRCKLLFVNTSVVDSKGLVHAKALKHNLVGCHLSVVCLIGLFDIQYAAAPRVLMVVFLVLVILYHISLNGAIDPLLYYLPRSLEAEETALSADDGLVHHDSAFGANTQSEPDFNTTNSKPVGNGTSPSSSTPSKVGMLRR